MDAGTPQNENERVIKEFYSLWEKSDVELLMPFFAEGASYTDMPLPPRNGLDEIRAYITGVFSAFTVEIETNVISSRGDLVLTERIDHLRLHATGAHSPLPIMGIVRLADGKIVEWRDYLDILTAEAGLGIPLRPEAAATA